MSDTVFAPLLATLGTHFRLSKSRLVTLAVLISGLAVSRTVNLSHLASHFSGGALQASNYRRLQRFFQHVRLEQDVTAQLIIGMLKLARRKRLALDRTNWKLGGRDINILVLAVVTRRFRVPLIWVQLDRAGNSDTEQRIALLQRYLDLFGAASIELLLADREFIGAKWMEFLCENNVPFAIRLRAGMLVTFEDGRRYALGSLLRKKRHGNWQGKLEGMETPLSFAAKRPKKGELIVVATNTQNPALALRHYRKRWAIECLFGDAKTRGLNLEDTHITDPDKLNTLLVIVAVAVAWAYGCASRVMGHKAIRRKTHRRREKSWFRIGLDALRRWLLNDKLRAIKIWTKAIPKKPFPKPQTA